MTQSSSLQASQAGAGAPIQMTALYAATAAADDTASGFVIGVTTTNVAPATLAGFTHYDGDDNTNAMWDSSRNTYGTSRSGGVSTSFVNQHSMTQLRRLDANYVAGRYLWFASFANDPPLSGDAPTSISASYLIR